MVGYLRRRVPDALSGMGSTQAFAREGWGILT